MKKTLTFYFIHKLREKSWLDWRGKEHILLISILYFGEFSYKKWEKNTAQALEALKFKKIHHGFSYLWNFNFQVERLPYAVLPMYYNQRISMYLHHTDYQVESCVCVCFGGDFLRVEFFSSSHLYWFVGTVWIFILNDLYCSFVYFWSSQPIVLYFSCFMGEY